MRIRIAHLSDTHLGYISLGASQDGVNQREMDVFLAFRRALESIKGYTPDLVIHSGDFFDRPRPGNFSIVGSYRALSDFQAFRNHAPFVIIAGNHDTPRSSDQGHLLALFRQIPGIQVVTGLAQWIDLPQLDCEVLCVPSTSVDQKENVDWVPLGRRKHSVLTIHGMASGVESSIDRSDSAAFDQESTKPERWTYVALGDYHTHFPYASNACYAGSTEFTDASFWKEAGSSKGWVWFDSEVGKLEHVPIKTRPVIDLPPIDARHQSPQELEEALIQNATWSSSQKLPMVRQRVMRVSPEVWARVNFAWKREVALGALNYQLQIEISSGADQNPDDAVTETRTLEVEWNERLENAEWPYPVARETVTQLGLELLAEVALDEAQTA